jgi:hypothetical protein
MNNPIDKISIEPIRSNLDAARLIVLESVVGIDKFVNPDMTEKDSLDFGSLLVKLEAVADMIQECMGDASQLTKLD